MSPRHSRVLADVSLVAVVAAWGYTFVPIKAVTIAWPEHWMLFNALRFWIATAAFLPVLLWRRPPAAVPVAGSLGPGLLTGMAMLCGYGFQTAGLARTEVAIAGFITGLSVVLVPIGARLLGHRLSWAAIAGVGFAASGLAFLCLEPRTAGLALGTGEFLVLLCAVSFATQILLTDRFARAVDPIRFTATQCVVTAVGATVWALWFEVREFGWPELTAGVWGAAAFCGVIGSTVSFTVQTVAQRVTPPTHVALIFALEPVFAALFATWLRAEVLTGTMLVGCALILCGMVWSELGPRLVARKSAAKSG